MFIAIRVVNLRVGDYVLYLQLAAIVGLVPLVFLIMDWVAHPLPSIVSVVFSFTMFVSVFVRYRRRVIKRSEERRVGKEGRSRRGRYPAMVERMPPTRETHIAQRS